MSESVRVAGTLLTLSHWQAAAIRPWEAGVYQRAAPAGPYACWTGKGWLRDARSPDEAARQTDASEHAAVAWRGLARPSGVVCPTCKGHAVVDRGVDPDTGDDLLADCPDCT